MVGGGGGGLKIQPWEGEKEEGKEVPYYYPYLAAEETKTERLNNLPKVTEQISGRSWLPPSHQAPKSVLLTPRVCCLWLGEQPRLLNTSLI